MTDSIHAKSKSEMPWCKGSNQPPMQEGWAYADCQVCRNEYKVHWLNGLIPRHKDRRPNADSEV